MTRRYHHGDLPSALLDALGEVVAERGASATSLREVARRAGVSHAAPAHHFGDKRRLLTAFATRGYRNLSAQSASALAEAGTDTGKRLRTVLTVYVRYAVEHPEEFQVMARPDLIDDQDPELRAVGEVSFSHLREAVESHQATGWRQSDDPLELAVAMWAAAHGVATLWLAGLVDEAIMARGLVHLMEVTVAATAGLTGASPAG